MLPSVTEFELGSRVNISVFLQNIVSPLSPIDIQVKTMLMDFDGKLILESLYEDVSVETQKSVTHELTIPEYLKPGQYICGPEISYHGNVYSTSKIVIIISPQKEELRLPSASEPIYGAITISAIIIAFTSAAVLLLYHHYLRHRNKRNKVEIVIKRKQ